MCIYKADAVNSNKSTQFLCVARSANAASTALGEAEQKTLPVLFLVLAYIYMKGGQLSERNYYCQPLICAYNHHLFLIDADSVFGFLEKCGLPVCSSGTGNSGNVDHSGDDATRPFGDVRKLVLDTFAKQMYIRKTKTTTEASNEVLVTLAWGQRAELEFARRDVLEAVAQLMGRPAESFAKQFDECRQAELAASAETGAAELED